MKVTSKLGMAGMTAMAGIAMMGAGSFALFTAHAASKTQSFASGVVDIAINHPGFATFSDNHPIEYYNMVPGDYATGSAVIRNTGTVNEIIDVDTMAKGPIFLNDGLNNGTFQQAHGSSSAALEKLSPVASTATSTYSGYWHPDLMTASKAPDGDGWLSYDYAATGNNVKYETDNHPAFYNVNYAIYSSQSQPVVTEDANGELTITGGVAPTHVVPNTPAVTFSYYQDATYGASGHPSGKSTTTWSGGTLGAYAPGTSTLWNAGTNTPGIDVNGNSKIKGIVLAPGQYLVVTYSGQLPLKASNDYQDAWGKLQVSFDAAQYENNHGGSENPVDINSPNNNLPTPTPPPATTPKLTFTSAVPQGGYQQGKSYEIQGILTDAGQGVGGQQIHIDASVGSPTSSQVTSASNGDFQFKWTAPDTSGNVTFTASGDGATGTLAGAIAHVNQPTVSGVYFFNNNNENDPTILVLGSGFGTHALYSGDGYHLGFQDLPSYWNESGYGWMMGDSNNGNIDYDDNDLPNYIGVNVEQWTNTVVEFTPSTSEIDPSPLYGSGEFFIQPGSPYHLGIQNPQSGQYHIFTGTVTYLPLKDLNNYLPGGQN
ncbi:MAG: TasA family protein [Alicyclobacillaceae bacterium]|nr:TasA family protein [Alicyclobacillaceae bacterium]